MFEHLKNTNLCINRSFKSKHKYFQILLLSYKKLISVGYYQLVGRDTTTQVAVSKRIKLKAFVMHFK